MNDVVNFLYTYLDDPAEIMSKARVLETINEIESLIKDRDDWLDRYLNSQARRHEALMEAEDAKEEIEQLRDALTYTQMAEQAALEDRAALRELLELSRPYVGQADGLLADRIDAFLKGV